MNKNRNGFIVLGFFLAVGGVYYYMTSTKRAYAKTIGKYTERDWRVYNDMDKGYLKARAKAIKSGASTFTYKSLDYLTSSGKRNVA